MADSKPTDDILWAESATGADIDNPSAKRPGGYQENDPLPYNQLNYLLRAAGRVGNFARNAFGTDNSKLTLSAENGEIILVDDPADIADAAYHDYAHITTATGGVLSRFTSQVLRALANKIQMGSRVLLESTVSTLIDLELKDEDGSPLLTRWVADALRVKSLTLPPGASAVDTLIGANLVKAAGSAVYDATAQTFTIASNSHNIATVIRESLGTYRITLTTNPDTHSDFSGSGLRSAVVSLGRNGGGFASGDVRFLLMGDASDSGVEFFTSDTAGNGADLPDGCVIHVHVA